MGRFDDLRQKAGITQPTGGGITKRPERVEISTRAVTPAPTPPIFPRPVRPTRIMETPSLDITQSPLMKTIQAQPVTSPPPTYLESLKSLIPTKEQMAGVFNLPTAQKAAETLINKLGRPSQIIAEYATPNAPFIGELPGGGYGEIPGTNARQAFLERTGQKPATGFGEKALGMVAAPFAVPGAGLGTGTELSQVAKQTLERITPKLASSLGGRVIQGAAVGAPIGAGTELATGTGRAGDVALGGALGAGIGAAAPLLGAAVGKGIQSLRELGAKRVAGVTTEVSGEAPIITRVGEVPPVAEPVPDVVPQEPITPRIEEPPLPSRPLTATSTPEEVLQSVQQPRVRDRVYNFLDEAEQAARERINKRRNIGFVPTGGNEAVDWSIIGAAKLGKGTIKAADWTEEMVKELGEDFRQHAPKIYQQSKELLRRQERIASKEGQAADVFNAGAGNAASFEQKISRQVNQRKKTWDQKTEQARTQFTDRRAALEGLEKRVTGKVASAESSLYKSSRLFAGVSEKANQIITDRLTPIINSVENAKYTSDDLGRYALAKHAQDVNNAGYKSGFTNAEIDDVIRKYESIPEMEQARLQLIQVNKDMLDELVNSGVTSAALRDTLNERWQNYIPLFRSFEDDPETFAAGLGQSLKSIGDPIKALKGSERAVIDPLENMVKSIYQSVTAAERNKVKLQLSNLSKADPDGNYIRKLSDDEAIGKKNVVPVRENGETVRYEVEPEVYKAFAGLDDESGNMLMNALAAPASWLRAGATLTPDFALRNPMRDVVQAFITSKSGFNPVIDFPIGMYQTITKGKYYKDWIDNLGAYGNTLSMDRDMHREALAAVLKEPVSKKFVNVISGKALVKLMRTITDTTESATKVGEYRKAIKKGVTPQEAAYRARDLMDFARAGTSIKPANRIISFLNANIQGKSKLLRSIKENPASTLTKMFTGVTVPTMGIYAWNHNQANEVQRQTIDEAPDWQKDAFWMVAVPGTDMVARIPKPFDVAPVFANLPERVLDRIYRSNPVEMDEWIKNTLKESALPTQISGLLPLIEGMSGYSFFRQGDIVPEREKGLQLKDQYDPIRTSEVAKLLASGVRSVAGEEGTFKNFGSPRIMENTIKGFTAGLGTYATDSIDALLKGPNVPFTGGKKLYPPLIERPTPPEKRAEQSPFARSFLVDPLGATKSMDKMYREIDRLSREESSRQLRGEEPTMIGKKTVHLPTETAKRLVDLQGVSKDISDINKTIRAIESDKVKTAKQKRNELEPLLAKRNKLSIEVMKNQKR